MFCGIRNWNLLISFFLYDVELLRIKPEETIFIKRLDFIKLALEMHLLIKIVKPRILFKVTLFNFDTIFIKSAKRHRAIGFKIYPFLCRKCWNYNIFVVKINQWFRQKTAFLNSNKFKIWINSCRSRITVSNI